MRVCIFSKFCNFYRFSKGLITQRSIRNITTQECAHRQNQSRFNGSPQSDLRLHKSLFLEKPSRDIKIFQYITKRFAAFLSFMHWFLWAESHEKFPIVFVQRPRGMVLTPQQNAHAVFEQFLNCRMSVNPLSSICIQQHGLCPKIQKQ